MRIHLVFVHGWGLGPAFWDDLSALFPNSLKSFIDLGFTGSVPSCVLPSEPATYITHSLGTLWALKNAAPRMEALIAINGFAYFAPFTPKSALLQMKKNLRQNPEQQMKEFCQAADIQRKTDPASAFNIPRLQEGLDHLINQDERQTLQTLDSRILSLAGARDNILPLEVMKQEWAGYNLKIHEEAGHALPQSHPQWCAEQIEAFLP